METADRVIAVCARKARWWSWPPSLALIRRDFIATLRLRRSFLLLALVVGLCLIVTAHNWPVGDTNLMAMGRFSRDIFGLLAIILLLAASVFPPGLAALAFAEERRLDTLDQLRLSLITTGGLVLAKMVSAVGLIALLFLAILPALGVLLFLVGISVVDVVAVAVAALTSALMGAAIGLLCAVRFRRPVVALVASYIGTGLAMGGIVHVLLLTLFLLTLLLHPFGADRVLSDLTRSSLLGQFANWLKHLLEDIFVAPYAQVNRTGGMTGPSVGRFVAYRMIVSAVGMLVAARLLRRPPKPPRLPQGKPIADPELLRQRRRRFPYYLIDPLRRRPLIPDDINPILIREWRHGLGSRAHIAIRIFVALFLVCLVFNLIAAWPSVWERSYQANVRATLIVQMVLTVAIVQILAAGVMAKEREHANLDLLRLTLLTPPEIARGKFGAAFVNTAPVLLAVLLAGFFLLFAAGTMGIGSFALALLGYATLYTCAWFALCLAFCVSVFTRTIAASLVWGFMLNAAAHLGPVVTAFVADEAAPASNGEFFLQFSPFFAYGFFHSGRIGLDNAQGDAIGWDILSLLSGYLGAGLALLALAQWWLGRHVAREP